MQRAGRHAFAARFRRRDDGDQISAGRSYRGDAVAERFQQPAQAHAVQVDVELIAAQHRIVDPPGVTHATLAVAVMAAGACAYVAIARRSLATGPMANVA